MEETLERFDRPLRREATVPVQLTDEVRAALEKYLYTELDTALAMRKETEKKWKDWVKQYNGRLEREDAGPNESDVDMGGTRKHSIQNVSRLLNPIFQQDQIFVCKPKRKGEMAKQAARFWERYSRQIEDKKKDLQLCNKLVKNAQIFGSGWVKVGWGVERQTVTEWVTPMDEMHRADLEANPATIATDGEKYLVERIIEIKAGPDDYVVRRPDILYPHYAGDYRKSPWLAEQLWLTPAEISDWEREEIYPKGTTEQMGEPEEVRDRQFAMVDEKGRSDEKPHHAMWEVYLDFDVDNDGYREEIICHFSIKKKKLAACWFNWWNEYRRPYVSWQYEPDLDDSPDGHGLCYLLESAHRAKMASFNTRLDTAIKANEIVLFCNDQDLMRNFTDGKLRGGIFFTNLTNPKENFFESKISQPWTQLGDFEAQCDAEMMALSAQSPLNFGVETVNRPTVSGTMQRLQEGAMPLFLMLDSFRETYAEIHKMRLARLKQFHPEGLVEVLLEDQASSAEGVVETLAFPDMAMEESVIVETKVSSGTISKELRRQEIAMIAERFPQMAQQVLGMATAAGNVGPAAMIAEELLKVYMGIVKEFLVEHEIDNAQQVGATLEGAASVGVQMARAIVQLQTQLQQTMGGMGAPGGAAPGQAPGPQGAPGAGPQQGMGPPPGPPGGGA